jgi:hypothetical protein
MLQVVVSGVLKIADPGGNFSPRDPTSNIQPAVLSVVTWSLWVMTVRLRTGTFENTNLDGWRPKPKAIRTPSDGSDGSQISAGRKGSPLWY